MLFNFEQSYIFIKKLLLIVKSFQCFCTFESMFDSKKVFLLFFLLLSFSLKAQFYDNGQDPASIKWKFIKTQHFKIIFPSEIEPQAQHVANMLEQAFLPLSASLKSKPVNISVILHNRSVTSNAMVPWAPKRMEFYTTPGQDDYPQPWFDQLVVHEFRHVAQYSKIYSGFTKALNYLFGQQITVAVFGVFVPLWFVEGDAVCTETAFSNSGRGRMPSFEMELRTQLLEKGCYKYDKAVFGSYKTFTPDRYVLGYHLVATAQKYFTYDVWETALRRTAHLPFMVVPFSSGVHKVSRMGKAKLYKFCMQKLDSAWRAQDNNIVKTKYSLLKSRRNKFFSSYNHGSFSDTSGYISVKSGIDDITRFISISNAGKEKRIFTPGDYNTNSLSYANGKIVWAETKSDLRWDNRSFSVIKSFNLHTHKVRKLTRRSRYFSPSLNHLGSKIVCMEQTTDSKSFIVILDAKTGALLNRKAADSGDYIMTPTWSFDDKEVVFIALNKFGKRICLWNVDGEMQNLTQPSFTNIQQPSKFGSNVFYVGAYSGINNIYRLDSMGAIYQITSSRYGVTDPSLSDDGKKIIYSDYSANGFRLVNIEIDSMPALLLDKVENKSAKIYKSLLKDATVLNFYESLPTRYPVRSYSKFLHLLNFHSWGPLSIDANNNTIKPGVQFSSQNALSTMIVSAGYDYGFTIHNQNFYTKVSYTGLFPIFDFQFNYQWNKHDSIRWDVFSAQVDTKIPFNLSDGKYYRLIQPQIGYSFANYLPRNNYPGDAISGYFHVLTYRLFSYNMIKTSPKDINPRWGQMIDIHFQHTPFNGLHLGNITAIETMFYFPGIGHHHSLNCYLAFQQIDAGQRYFSDIIASPQGYDLTGFHQLLTGKFNYEFPLFYPDWSIFSAL